MLAAQCRLSASIGFEIAGIFTHAMVPK